MNHRHTLAILALAFSTIVQAQETGVSLAMKLIRNGELIGAPEILAKFGQESAVQVSSDFRIEITSTDLGATVDMRIKLFAGSEGNLALVAQPRMHAAFNVESKFTITGQDGIQYTVIFQPTKRPLPS